MSSHIKIIDLVSIGRIEEVKKLIASGCDVNEQADLGYCALFAAINRNDVPMIKLLIDAGARVDVECWGESALSRARKNNYVEIVTIIENILERDNNIEEIKMLCRQLVISSSMKKYQKAFKLLGPGVFILHFNAEQSKDLSSSVRNASANALVYISIDAYKILTASDVLCRPTMNDMYIIIRYTHPITNNIKEINVDIHL